MYYYFSQQVIIILTLFTLRRWTNDHTIFTSVQWVGGIQSFIQCWIRNCSVCHIAVFWDGPIELTLLLTGMDAGARCGQSHSQSPAVARLN